MGSVIIVADDESPTGVANRRTLAKILKKRLYTIGYIDLALAVSEGAALDLLKRLCRKLTLRVC